MQRLDKVICKLWDPQMSYYTSKSGTQTLVTTLPRYKQITSRVIEQINRLAESVHQQQSEFDLIRREASLSADKVIRYKQQCRSMQTRLLPKLERLLRIDSQLVKIP